jgi:hypothetical protein
MRWVRGLVAVAVHDVSTYPSSGSLELLIATSGLRDLLTRTTATSRSNFPGPGTRMRPLFSARSPRRQSNASFGSRLGEHFRRYRSSGGVTHQQHLKRLGLGLTVYRCGGYRGVGGRAGTFIRAHRRSGLPRPLWGQPLRSVLCAPAWLDAQRRTVSTVRLPTTARPESSVASSRLVACESA